MEVGLLDCGGGGYDMCRGSFLAGIGENGYFCLVPASNRPGCSLTGEAVCSIGAAVSESSLGSSNAV